MKKIRIPNLNEEIVRKFPRWKRELYYMLKEIEKKG